MQASGEGLVRIRQAASELSISVRTLRKLIRAGELPVIRVSARLTAVHPGDLREFINKRRAVGQRS